MRMIMLLLLAIMIRSGSDGHDLIRKIVDTPNDHIARQKVNAPFLKIQADILHNVIYAVAGIVDSDISSKSTSDASTLAAIYR